MKNEVRSLQSVSDLFNQLDPFGRSIVVSVAFHIFVLLFFAIKTYVFPRQAIVVREAIRVDIVGLPDKLEKRVETEDLQDKKKVSDVSLSTNEVDPLDKSNRSGKKESKVDLKKAQIEQSKAMAKLNALSAIAKMEKELKEKENNLKKNSTSTAHPLSYKGNVLSAGDSLTGLNALDHEQYFSRIKTQVQKSFILPQWLAESRLKAQVHVKIDERGYVISREITQTSGDPTFDTRVTEAIDRASPFSPPPPRLVNVLAVNGLVFNFPD